MKTTNRKRLMKFHAWQDMGDGTKTGLFNLFADFGKHITGSTITTKTVRQNKSLAQRINARIKLQESREYYKEKDK